MSTQYMFVKEQRRKEADQLSAILQIINNNAKNALADARETLPEMMDDIDTIGFELDAAIRRCSPSCYGENEIIGNSSSTRFSWRTDNGFSDIGSVEEFLAGHPGWRIEDEYGTAIPLGEFRKIVRK